MKERYALIDGKVCRRISRRKAQKLCETTEIPVYCFPVYAAPSSPFSVGILMNVVPQTKDKFYGRMYEFMYYNANRQMGYYAAFYTSVEGLQ